MIAGNKEDRLKEWTTNTKNNWLISQEPRSNNYTGIFSVTRPNSEFHKFKQDITIGENLTMPNMPYT